MENTAVIPLCNYYLAASSSTVVVIAIGTSSTGLVEE